MISPELIRRYPFFWCIDDAQQKAVAMIAEEAEYPKGATIFDEGQPADTLYLLMEGSVALCIYGEGERHRPGQRIHVGEINPGEPFGIAAMLDNQTYTSCAEATSACRVIKIDATELRKLMAFDCSMGYCLMQQMAKASLERLRLTHIQLAAAQT